MNSKKEAKMKDVKIIIERMKVVFFFKYVIYFTWITNPEKIEKKTWILIIYFKFHQIFFVPINLYYVIKGIKVATYIISIMKLLEWISKLLTEMRIFAEAFDDENEIMPKMVFALTNRLTLVLLTQQPFSFNYKFYF